MKNKQEIIYKNIPNDEYEYVRYDEETGYHLINRIRGRVCYEEEEFDYIETDRDLMFHIHNVMDDDTGLLIVQADKVEGAPENLDGYFIY